jgi:murein DD-endopeptidase MepM/ murein hydrolase activator NlpD
MLDERPRSVFVAAAGALTLSAAAFVPASGGAAVAPAVDDGGSSAPASEPAVGAGVRGHLAPPAPPGDSAALERGRRLTGSLLEGEVDSIAARMAPASLESLGGREGLGRGLRKIRSAFGEETETLREDVYTRRSVVHYYRLSRFAGSGDRSVAVHWAWRGDGAVVAVEARPTPRPATTGHEDRATTTELRLPFEGEWYVAWGGRRPHQNRHVRARDQRFAYDFVVLEDGATHEGDGAANGDYHCFGRPVLAPGPGRVVTAVDSVPDNEPGRTNRGAPPGNHVVVDHGHGEFSLLAHFRRGSIEVQEGDRVEAGQRLGACGNSGNSSEPHVHYHLQDGPGFGEAVGLPAQFRGYRADGAPVDRGEPVRGQLVRQGEGR